MLFTREEIRELVPFTEIKSGIYKIENTVNGKIYIGQAVDVYRRMKKHFWDVDHGNSKYFAQEIKQYGIKAFTACVLEFCEKEKLYERERYYIEKYDSYNNGYNLGRGGQHNDGRIVSEEDKQKTRENNLLGKSHFAKKTICDGIEFDTAKECADYLRITYYQIKDWLGKYHKMPYEYYIRGLRYADKTMDDYTYSLPKKIQIEFDGKIYPSIRNFCKENNIDRNIILKIRRGEKDIPDYLLKKGFKFIGGDTK